MDRIEEDNNITQTSYKSTPYEDQSWEILGEHVVTEDFLPMEVETIDGERVSIDPMFPDYGGHYGEEGSSRYYLQPGEIASKKTQEEEDAEKGIVRIDINEYKQSLQEAEERGRVEATEKLIQENEQRMRQVEESINAMFRDYQAQVAENMTILEHKAVELSVSISEKIIGYAVEINPEYIIPLVKEALKLVGSAHVSKVHVSPQDLEFIEVLGIQKAIREFSEIDFVADDTIRSGCIVETSAGQIDYQLDKAWERVRDDVVKAVA